MAGTLTTSAEATSFRFLNGDHLPVASSIESTSNVYMRRNRNVPKASLHAVIDEPRVQSTKIKSMSLYQVLSLDRNATHAEVKSAYRSLAKRYHPDASSSNQNDDDDDDRDFIGIRNAYVTLSDPRARALYDVKLSGGFERRSGGLYSGAARRWETDQCW